MKPLLIYCLCVTMLVTSAAGAFARGHMAFGQTVQICAEGEAVVIRVDAEGNPMQGNLADPAHPCPECLAVTAGLPPPDFAFVQTLRRWQSEKLTAGAVLLTRSFIPHPARGPPVVF